MGLRVDREAALGWLGIEGFRPSGRMRPTERRAVVADDSRTEHGPAEQQGEQQGDSGSGPIETLIETPVDVTKDVRTPPSEMAVEGSRQQETGAEVATTTARSADEVPADRLYLAFDSPHRALAEAIARAAGLACETGEGGDVVTVSGQTWELAALAGDGAAKRCLWQTLVARGRRRRG